MEMESQTDRCRHVGMLAQAILRMSDEHRRVAVFVIRRYYNIFI
jgi:hypothetical protein